MAKYGYSKDVLKGLSIGNFLGEVKLRNKHIEEASDAMPQSIFNSNILAGTLHPSVQHGIITQVIDHGDAKSFVIAPDKEKGTKSLAYFRAGQYVSVDLTIHGIRTSKPYTLRSCPLDALDDDSSYTITVKQTKNGLASKYILSEWKTGTPITLSGPCGDFCHNSLRDAKNVVAIAGGSGITPFCSMAAAVSAGLEDFNLTILYGSRDKDSILLNNELDAIVEKSNGKVKLVNVLSNDDSDGFEHGFITAELIKKYAPAEDYSIYVCGPKAMYDFLHAETAKLNLPKRRIRFEVPGEYGDPTKDTAYPADAGEFPHMLTVIIHGTETTVPCNPKKSLLEAIEAAGIAAPSKCRSGECGWCHSRLVSGEVYIPASADGRREADKKFGWIHPCATYALSDVTVEIFPIVR